MSESNQSPSSPIAKTIITWMIIIILILFIAWVVKSRLTIKDHDQAADLIETRLSKEAYADSILLIRKEKDVYFADSLSSPLNSDDLIHFTGLNYFDPDMNFIVTARIVRDTMAEVFSMATTTERLPQYRRYGVAYFELADETYKLSIYQNIDILEKNPDSKHLFLPFKDLTNRETTYGGGRYLDLELPETDHIVIDFNLCYNPYCAYDDRWSCPLTPLENYLDTYIEAGEKRYP